MKFTVLKVWYGQVMLFVEFAGTMEADAAVARRTAVGYERPLMVGVDDEVDQLISWVQGLEYQVASRQITSIPSVECKWRDEGTALATNLVPLSCTGSAPSPQGLIQVSAIDEAMS